MIDINTRLCCAGASFVSSLITYFEVAALVPNFEYYNSAQYPIQRVSLDV